LVFQYVKLTLLFLSAVIPGVSIKHMCTQIKDAVDKEQDKLLWVPVTSG